MFILKFTSYAWIAGLVYYREVGPKYLSHRPQTNAKMMTPCNYKIFFKFDCLSQHAFLILYTEA